MAETEFEILGDPMGKGRPKFRSVGKYVQTYTPKETMSYESKVIFSYKTSKNPIYFETKELEVDIIAYFKLQKSHYGKKGINKSGIEKLTGIVNPTSKPDCDNIAKIVLDALNGIAYHDDSQITKLNVLKRYSETPRVWVRIRERNSTNGKE